MVRNIDLPEALVLYGPDLSPAIAGLTNLLKECHDIDTAVIAINIPEGSFGDSIIYRAATAPPPDPRDVWQAIHSIDIQPRPFGGSSGFGARQFLDPPRSPLPARTVVIGTTLEQTRAARYAGMRSVSLHYNTLVDAVLDDFENVWLEDLATPGSFWLNPPHPRDDDGNKVDPEKFSPSSELQGPSSSSTTTGSYKDDDDELNRILADLAPLE